MGESIYSSIEIRMPKAWCPTEDGPRPWFVEALAERFYDYVQVDWFDVTDGSITVNIAGTLNYGWADESEQHQLMETLIEQRIPFTASEEGGPGWTATWHLFNGVNYWSGLGDDEPLLSHSDWKSITDGTNKTWSSVEEYFAVGSIVATGDQVGWKHLLDVTPPISPTEQEDIDAWLNDFFI